MESIHNLKLNKCWKTITPKYKIKEFIGKGVFGEVVKAQNRLTKQIIAIKMMKINLNNMEDCKIILRELQIMEQFTLMKENIFTTKLIEIIAGDEYESYETIYKVPAIFIVMSFHKFDLRTMIASQN